MRRAALPKGLKVILIISAVIHLLAIVALATGLPESKSRDPKTVIVTKLVRLGEERPPDYLPRKDEPPPLVPEKPVTVEQPKIETPKEVTATPALESAKNRVKQMSRVNSALDRLKQQTQEGHKEGVVDGEARHLKDALIGNKYHTEIHRCMHNNYNLEGISLQRVKGKVVVVKIYVALDGTITRTKVVESSGIHAFDQSVERSVHRCGKVSPPPKEMRAQVQEGVEIEFQP